jgi:hypothetical protein
MTAGQQSVMTDIGREADGKLELERNGFLLTPV